MSTALWLDQHFDLLLITSTVSFRMPTPSVDRPEAELERRKRSIKNLVFSNNWRLLSHFPAARYLIWLCRSNLCFMWLGRIRQLVWSFFSSFGDLTWLRYDEGDETSYYDELKAQMTEQAQVCTATTSRFTFWLKQWILFSRPWLTLHLFLSTAKSVRVPRHGWRDANTVWGIQTRNVCQGGG